MPPHTISLEALPLGGVCGCTRANGVWLVELDALDRGGTTDVSGEVAAICNAFLGDRRLASWPEATE